jgi:hypothetical protein
VPESHGRGASPLGSNVQSSRTVTAFSAITFMVGVVAYNTPPTTMGLLCISQPGNASPESEVHATFSRLTLDPLI